MSSAPGLGRAEVLLEGFVGRGGYDISPDGQRFLVMKEDASSVNTSGGPQIILVQNWHEELKRLVPVDVDWQDRSDCSMCSSMMMTTMPHVSCAICDSCPYQILDSRWNC